MSKIFTGFIFVFLDFNININAMQIGLIPDFVGYLFVMSGLAELLEKSAHFKSARPLAAVMAVYTGILYLTALFGLQASFGPASPFFLGAISMVLSLYISYRIVMGVKDLERSEGRRLYASELYSHWLALAVFSTAAYIVYMVPALAIPVIIGGFIVGILFITAFSRSKNAYCAIL